MINMNPYLSFGGKTREVFAFYAQCFKGGEISGIQTFADGGIPVDDSNRDKVLHAEFKAGNVHLMATDAAPNGKELKQGENISLCLNFSDEAEQAEVFNALAEGGTIGEPLKKAFWGGTFGFLTDRYGIQWMFNSSPAQ